MSSDADSPSADARVSASASSGSSRTVVVSFREHVFERARRVQRKAIDLRKIGRIDEGGACDILAWDLERIAVRAARIERGEISIGDRG